MSEKKSENNENLELAKERNFLASERTRLAAERTISAWMRTGLASVGAGFAIIKLIYFQQEKHRLLAHGIGEVLIIWGMVIFIFALINFRHTCKALSLSVNQMNERWVTTTIFVFLFASLFLLLVTLT